MILIQENDWNIRYWYWYKKMIEIYDIDDDTRKWLKYKILILIQENDWNIRYTGTSL